MPSIADKQAAASGLEGIGYWQVTWLYLTSLLKLGEVYEVAGSHEDALHAFKEGQELVCRQIPAYCLIRYS